MKTYDARAVANFLLDYADEKKVKVTLLSILKMIYYAHGWYLTHREQPLVDQPFEAWPYGPVVRAVCEAFRGNGRAPLTSRAERLDVIANTYCEIRDPIEDEQVPPVPCGVKYAYYRHLVRTRQIKDQMIVEFVYSPFAQVHQCGMLRH